MDETIVQVTPLSKKDALPKGWLIVAVSFGLLWFELINQLKGEWWLNPQYNYGVIVPILLAYLLWKRWKTRPPPMVTTPKTRTLSILLIGAGAVLFLLIRFVAEANPDWRLLSWLLALVVVTISLSYIYLTGGASWLRYFAFPLLFFLVAVPWPVRIEQLVIQNLMRAVTAINVIFLQLAGVPALQHGNVIEVGSGFIGIEEACSGVRSLQATLMISLFLGELYSFNAVRRLVLVAVGAAFAFVCNVVRTAILVWVGTSRGASGIEAWHDPAGLTILIVCLFGLWVASLVMLRRGGEAPISRIVENESATAHFSWAPVALLICWLVLAEGAVQAWYRAHQPAVTLHWAVHWPDSESNYKSVPIATAAESLLQYNEGGGASWEGADGRHWLMFFFKWFPGRTAARFTKVHRPDICLPASGRTMERDYGLRILTVHGVSLPIRSYRFTDTSQPLHVFYCYWDARSSYDSVASTVEEDWSFRGRLRAAFRGRREIGAQILEIVVWGYEDDNEAVEALTRELNRVVQVS